MAMPPGGSRPRRAATDSLGQTEPSAEGLGSWFVGPGLALSAALQDGWAPRHPGEHTSWLPAAALFLP